MMELWYRLGGEIPDARTIHMIRKQRQYKREQGDDVIPLEEPVNKSKTARLVRCVTQEHTTRFTICTS